MIRHYVTRRAKVIFDHPHNAEEHTSATQAKVGTMNASPLP